MDSAIDPTPPPIDERTSSKGNAGKTEDTRPEEPTLEEEVKQLASSVSTWWSGFSKRSQEQLNEVKAQIDSQGGIVSIAKREAARFEAQLNDAQKAARDDVKAAASEDGKGHKKRVSVVDIDVWGTAGLISSETDEQAVGGSGKGKQKQVEGDDGAAVERLEERARSEQQERAGSGAEKLSMQGGQALFDADAPSDSAAPGSEFKVIEDAAQTAMHSMQSFWERIQTDPRVNNMQQSVAKTLQNISVPSKKAAGGVDAAASADANVDRASPQTKKNLALPDLSKQFQAAFPALDLKESQAMAKRYFEASQSAARDWSKEMGTLMSDLVKVIPPPDEEKKANASPPSAPSSADDKPATSAGLKATRLSAKRNGKTTATGTSAADAIDSVSLQASTDDDDFDWDREVEAGSSVVGGGLETTTAPPTASWEDDAEADVQTISEAEEQGAKASKSKAEDEEDSDWE